VCCRVIMSGHVVHCISPRSWCTAWQHCRLWSMFLSCVVDELPLQTSALAGALSCHWCTSPAHVTRAPDVLLRCWRMIQSYSPSYQLELDVRLLLLCSDHAVGDDRATRGTALQPSSWPDSVAATCAAQHEQGVVTVQRWPVGFLTFATSDAATARGQADTWRRCRSGGRVQWKARKRQVDSAPPSAKLIRRTHCAYVQQGLGIWTAASAACRRRRHFLGSAELAMHLTYRAAN
jgi:hypothetical protein